VNVIQPIKKTTALFMLMFCCFAFAVWAVKQDNLDVERLLAHMEKKYDVNAKKRTRAWRTLVETKQQDPEMEKLKQVNRFFNLFRFVDDIDHWKQNDYWATPIEFIGTMAGDCEDFSIAKYFTLLELGVPIDKLRLTYVKATTLNQFHMVLAYYPKPNAMPLILDNIDGAIKPANKRRDLKPIYSFNGQKLWLNKQKGKGKLLGGPEKLDHWNNLTKRYQLTDFEN